MNAGQDAVVTAEEYRFGTEQPEMSSLPLPTSVEDGTVHVCIPGLITYVGVVRQAVDALSEQLQFAPDARAAVKLAVGEACNNAILHSLRLPDGSPSTVIVVCRVTRSALEIDVTNRSGDEFRPSQHSPKMPEANLLAEHGRGIALMEIMMDSVEYIACHGSTTVRMRKFRMTEAPGN